MNVVTLAGRLAKDPDVRNTNSGKTVAQGLARGYARQPIKRREF